MVATVDVYQITILWLTNVIWMNLTKIGPFKDDIDRKVETLNKKITIKRIFLQGK